MKSKLARFGLGVVVLFTGCVGLTAARQDRKFEAPMPEIHASKDPAVVERGRYLVTGAAHCADCHGDNLSGGYTFNLPVGKFHVPNITPDQETGIGRYQDPELARALRYGVHPTGRAMLPFMPFKDLADDDLTAIISYLREQPAVSHPVPAHEPNTAGKVVKAWVIGPKGPDETPPKTMKPTPTAAYGEYLANSVANCVGCHTKVDMRTGAFAGAKFGGGAVHPSMTDPNKKFVAPNLTPDTTWGWITGWSEDMFVARMHAGRVHDGSPMPWPSFKNMSDDDLRAIHRYLRTLPPAAGGPDPAQRETSVFEHATASR